MNHNLAKNYFNASGDVNMKRDILLSEIAKKLYTDRQGVIDQLKLTGFSVPATVSDDTLVKMVASALSQSRRFATILTKNIVKGSYTFAGDADTTKKPIDFGKLIGDSAQLISGIGSIFGGKDRAKADLAKAEAEKARAERELADKLGAIKLTQKTGSNMVYWVAGGLLVAGIIGTTIYFIVKK